MDDSSMDAKFDDFAKRDGRTERRTERRMDGATDGWSDGRKDRQTHRLIGMRWTHPKTRPIAISRVLRANSDRPTDEPTNRRTDGQSGL